MPNAEPTAPPSAEAIAATRAALGGGQPDQTEGANKIKPEGDAQPKAAEPPAQHGDEGETHVAEAKPVLLPTKEQGKAELDANPARTSVLTDAGHLVRE